MSDLARTAIIEGISVALAVVSTAVSLAVLLNVRGLTVSIVGKSRQLGQTILGVLFRGEMSLGLARLLAAGLLMVGLQPVFRLSLPAAGTGTDMVLLLFVWAYLSYAVIVRIRSGFRRMVPPVTFLITVLLVVIYVGDAVALTSLPVRP